MSRKKKTSPVRQRSKPEESLAKLELRARYSDASFKLKISNAASESRERVAIKCGVVGLNGRVESEHVFT